MYFVLLLKSENENSKLLLQSHSKKVHSICHSFFLHKLMFIKSQSTLCSHQPCLCLTALHSFPSHFSANKKMSCSSKILFSSGTAVTVNECHKQTHSFEQTQVNLIQKKIKNNNEVTQWPYRVVVSVVVRLLHRIFFNY